MKKQSSRYPCVTPGKVKSFFTFSPGESSGAFHQARFSSVLTQSTARLFIQKELKQNYAKMQDPTLSLVI